MIPLLEAYWPLLLVALVIGIAVSWFLLRANRKTRVTVDRRDVLDEGAAPAARNQALIDSGKKGEDTPRQSDTASAPADGDDLTRIKGLGAKLQARLHELGVISFAQIAKWDEAEIDRIDGQLGQFEGRIRRDNWVEQAKLLAEGHTEMFDQKFGNL